MLSNAEIEAQGYFMAQGVKHFPITRIYPADKPGWFECWTATYGDDNETIAECFATWEENNSESLRIEDVGT